MTGMHKITSRPLALHFDHLDNNDLVPKYQAKKAIKKGSGSLFLSNHRNLPGLPKRPDPDHPLNQEDKKGRTILIPGAYFATEIDIEQAVWAVMDAGFDVVVSNEIGQSFQKMAHRNGLLCVRIKLEELRELEADADRVEVRVDLENQTLAYGDQVYTFDIDSDEKGFLLHGLEDIDYTLNYQAALDAYEREWDPIFGS